MKKEFLLVLVLIVFFTTFGCNSAIQKSPALSESPDEIVINQKTESLMKTLETGDFEASLNFYADNAHIMTGGDKPKLISKDEYAKRYRNRIKKAGKKKIVSYEVISYGRPQIEFASPNKANVTVINKIKTPRGKVITVNNRYVFTKDTGDWLIIERTYTF